MSRLLCLAAAFWCSTIIQAQREQQISPPADTQQYGRRFFVQLRGVFGRFRDADLQRAFETAQPIQCAELINDKGDWKTVAFFNEKRELGDWYRSNFDEVKNDLSSFIFKGVCRGEHGPVQLTTKFPVTESTQAYERGRIPIDEVEVNVNAPVSAFFDPRSQAYQFDLPYLFLVHREGDESIYSLDPPLLADRDRYATDVIDHWDCKSVTADAVTYRFLICRTTTQPRNPAARSQNRAPAFGASAYFILSDGKEASSSVKLSFNNASVEDVSGPPPVEVPPARADWQTPDAEEKIVDLQRDEFRIRFAPTWTGKLNSAQILYGQTLSGLESATPPAGVDYCVWLPGTGASVQRLLANEPDDNVISSMTPRDQDALSATSITFDVKMGTGVHLGSLRCTFPRTPSAASVSFGRWTSITGTHLNLEVR